MIPTFNNRAMIVVKPPRCWMALNQIHNSTSPPRHGRWPWSAPMGAQADWMEYRSSRRVEQVGETSCVTFAVVSCAVSGIAWVQRLGQLATGKYHYPCPHSGGSYMHQSLRHYRFYFSAWLIVIVRINLSKRLSTYLRYLTMDRYLVLCIAHNHAHTIYFL